MLLEGTLLEKLRKIEALYARTTVDGEKEAARRAAERIRTRLAELRGHEKDAVLRYRIRGSAKINTPSPYCSIGASPAGCLSADATSSRSSSR
jgi:hypothetical protein